MAQHEGSGHWLFSRQGAVLTGSYAVFFAVMAYLERLTGLDRMLLLSLLMMPFLALIVISCLRTIRKQTASDAEDRPLS